MKTILFVNHRTKECGVQQMGARYYEVLKLTQKYQCFYIDVDERWECEHWMNELKPAAVVFNFYSGATMHWLSNEMIDSHRNDFKQLCIYHELDLMTKGFDLLLHQDPDSTDPFPHWKLPRCIPDFPITYPEPEIATFGSFGFGLGGKGFGTLVKMVNEQYDEALVRLHIPFAAFGDADGKGARSWVASARELITKQGIELEVTHDFWDEPTLLDWLARNTCNAFLYDGNYGRGISGTVDYSLGVRRPIAITKSYQFKHVWMKDESFCVENKTLPEIIAMGTDHLEKFHDLWSQQNLIRSFEQALESLGV